MPIQHKNITIREVAEIAGVSTATISRVLNHSDKVSPQTAAHVEAILERTGYACRGRAHAERPERAARNRRVLIIVPSLANTFFGSVISAITSSLSLADVDVNLSVTGYSVVHERRALQQLAAGVFDGAISFHTELGAEEMSQFIGKYPFVMSCNYQEQLHCSTVAIDDRKAMFELAEYLIQRGHGRIALITGVAGPSIQRKQGYLDALAQYGIPVRPEYIVEPVRQYGFEYEVGARFCEQFLSLPEPPTAILCTFDTYAVGAVSCAVRRGVRVGEELAVIGFDNSPISKVFYPTVSSVSHPVQELGANAAQLLLGQMQTGDLTPKTIFLPHELILRESCR